MRRLPPFGAILALVRSNAPERLVLDRDAAVETSITAGGRFFQVCRAGSRSLERTYSG